MCKLTWTLPVLAAANVCAAQCEPRWMDTSEMVRPGVTSSDGFGIPRISASAYWTPPK